ncbi:MAG: enoyl-CoA hydratase-related protein [Nioella sp.]
MKAIASLLSRSTRCRRPRPCSRPSATGRLVLTGSGEKAFVAGADISELSTLNPLQARYFAEKGHILMDKLQELPIPVIAMVNGFALGGGLEIALSCDFIYASDNAKIGLPEITLGLIPGFGGTQRLSRIVGKNLAKEMIFTGKMLSVTNRSRSFCGRRRYEPGL